MIIRNMEKCDKNHVLSLVNQFYQSDAVMHDVDQVIKERCFDEAMKQYDSFQGFVFINENEIVGYAYVTFFFTTEMGGLTLMIEQLFIDEKARNKGFGTEFILWLKNHFPDVRRLRLEINNDNDQAIAFYKRIGFSFLDYGQMMMDI